MRDRTELGLHEPYRDPTLAAKVRGRRGQGSPGREGEHAGPGKSGAGDSWSDGARAARAHSSAGVTTGNALKERSGKSPRRRSERQRKRGKGRAALGIRKSRVAKGRELAYATRTMRPRSGEKG